MEKYIADLTYIPMEFINNNSKYKYILAIIDHFSKLTGSYLLINKKKDTILEKIKNFFAL